MKNYIILFLFCISFQNCASQKFTAEQRNLIEIYQIPSFSTQEITNFTIEYANYFQDLMDAANAGDATKLQELTAQGVEWSKKASEWTQKMTPEDAQKWFDWASKLHDAATKR